MMKITRLSKTLDLRVLIYEQDEEDEDECIVALAVDMDLRGYGDSEETAFTEMEDLVDAQIGFAQSQNDSSQIFFLADQKYIDMFEAVEKEKKEEEEKEEEEQQSAADNYNYDDASMMLWVTREGYEVKLLVGTIRDFYTYSGKKYPRLRGKTFRLSRLRSEIRRYDIDCEYHEVPCKGNCHTGPCCDLAVREKKSHDVISE